MQLTILNSELDGDTLYVDGGLGLHEGRLQYTNKQKQMKTKSSPKFQKAYD